MDRRQGHLTKPGFFAGFAAAFRGTGYVIATPRVWPAAAVPALMALVVFGATAALGIWSALRAAAGLAGDGALGTLLQIVFALVALLVAYLVAMALAQPFSGWAIDRLVRGRERALGETRTWPEVPLSTSLVRSIGVSLTGLAVTLPILALLFLVEFVLPPAAVVCIPLKLLVAGLGATWDFLDYPFSLRGLGVRARVRWMTDHLGAVTGFAIAASLLVFLPCVGLLVLPFGVAGATTLVVDAERGSG